MKIKSILLATAAVFSLSSVAFAVDKESYQATTKIEKDSDGNYTENNMITKTEANGTTNSSEKNLSIIVDSKGNINKSKTTEVIHDPKGLGNKHVVTTKDTEKTKDGETTAVHEKTVNGKNVEGKTDHYKTSSKIQKDDIGNYVEKDITTKTEADGTTVSFEKDADVTVDANGDTDKSTTTKKTINPKGSMSKTTTKTSNTEKTADGMVTTSQDVTVDGKTVESKSKTVPQQ